MPIVCVDIILSYDNHILLIRRNNHPAKNQWWFPGGRIYKGETIAQASIRKAKDELGLDCKFNKILGLKETYFEREEDMAFDIHTINITVELELIDDYEPLLILDKDHSDYKWINYNSKDFHVSIQNILKKKKLKFALPRIAARIP